jgi:5-methylcytosine-specific restriction protein A
MSWRPCAEHDPQRLDNRRRGSAAQQGYGARHRQWAAMVLRRSPLCAICTTAPAHHADHIVPIKAGGARFELSNGQGLCTACHSRKSLRERRYGQTGIGGRQL